MSFFDFLTYPLSWPHMALSGFGIYNLGYLIFRKRIKPPNSFLFKGIDEAACQILAVFGLVYLGLSLYEYIWIEPEWYSQAFLGKYWYFYWTGILSYAVVTQLFWFKKARLKTWLRLITSFVLLFSYERFVIVITSFHRDYLPTNLFLGFDWMLIRWAQYLLVFFVLLILYQLNHSR